MGTLIPLAQVVAADSLGDLPGQQQRLSDEVMDELVDRLLVRLAGRR